ncbi:hypothetical protein JYJ93_33830 [Corallococcus sp. NCSPR001]|nr:hypothetical protein [Corallococcus sp. NCSPR001]
MDGARLFNACVASGVSAARFAAQVDTLWVDFTKGLGAPIVAILAGSKDFIAQARRYKHVFGGAMRQAEDHANAQKLAGGLARIPGILAEDAPPRNQHGVLRCQRPGPVESTSANVLRPLALHAGGVLTVQLREPGLHLFHGADDDVAPRLDVLRHAARHAEGDAELGAVVRGVVEVELVQAVLEVRPFLVRRPDGHGAIALVRGDDERHVAPLVREALPLLRGLRGLRVDPVVLARLTRRGVEAVVLLELAVEVGGGGLDVGLVVRGGEVDVAVVLDDVVVTAHADGDVLGEGVR